jgi:transcriptional regulator with XRE-family HTH domain
MNLNDLHRRLSKKSSYTRKYELLGDEVELAMHVKSVRDELGVTQEDLALELGIAQSEITKFESFKPVSPQILSLIVDRFEVRLKEQGVKVEHWIIRSASPPNPRHGLGASRIQTAGLDGRHRIVESITADRKLVHQEPKKI